MQIQQYYIVREYLDMRHRKDQHKIEAGPFFELWRARECLDAIPKTHDSYLIYGCLLELEPVASGLLA